MASKDKAHVIILAAGYATRLYPLTLEKPKPLLKIADRPILEHILDKIDGFDDIEKVHFITNDKFSSHFANWHNEYSQNRTTSHFNFINDGSKNEDDKLGAIGDLHLAIEKESIDNDVYVIAGDNLFSHELAPFAEFAREVNAPVIGVYDIGDMEQIKKYSSISVNNDGMIEFFEEKPAVPKSTLTGIALYYYPRHTLPLIKEYVRSGNNPDQPGRLVQWLYKKMPFYTWKIEGTWYDVGSKETLAQADDFFRKNQQLVASE